MAALYRAFGVLALAGACISAVLGLLSLPRGGLIFALSYFCFGLAIDLGVVGGVCGRSAGNLGTVGGGFG